MPQAFDNCVSGGGRVRTKKLGGGKYMHLCFKGGKSFAGHVKQVKGQWNAGDHMEPGGGTMKRPHSKCRKRG